MSVSRNTMLLNANALRIPLADESVHCVVTSPPYWGLRDYGTATWKGGEAGCDHIGDIVLGNNRNFIDREGRGGNKSALSSGNCGKCGAVRIDAQLGLEATIDEAEAELEQAREDYLRDWWKEIGVAW